MEPNKFVVVIPTMGKCVKTFTKLLEVLNAAPQVKRIIIINNTGIRQPIDYGKNYTYNMNENLYVNPSWNFGVSIAFSSNVEFNNIVLLSDDVLIPNNFFEFFEFTPFENIGVCGMLDPAIIRTRHDDIDFFNVKVENKDHILIPSIERTWGFGTVMILHVNNWIPIPEELKVWCGDDFLFHYFRKKGLPNYFIGVPIKTQMSTTSDLSEYMNIKNNDVIEYEKYK